MYFYLLKINKNINIKFYNMKKFIYTFILLAGFQFAQGQDVLLPMYNLGQGWKILDSAAFNPISPPGAYLNIGVFFINTSGQDMNAGDTISLSYSLNGEEIVGAIFFLNSTIQSDSAALLNYLQVPIYTDLLKPGAYANELCINVSYVVIGGVKDEVNSMPACAVFTAQSTTSISKIDNLKGVMIYPNPVRDNLKIDNLEENIIIDIYSIAGQKVHTVSSAMGSTEIDMSKLSNGIYIVKMQSGKNIRTEKIQVLR